MTKCALVLALPDRDILNKVLPWNTHLTDREILEGLSLYFADFNTALAMDFKRIDEHHIRVMATPLPKIEPFLHTTRVLDPESYAIARALKNQGMVQENTFGFYYREKNTIKFSIFTNNDLLFFHEDDTLQKIEQLFKTTFPEHENIAVIELNNKPFLLNLGLALHDDTDWNLLPWRAENTRFLHRRGLLFLAKSLAAGIILSLLAHIILLAFLYFQESYNKSLTRSLESLSTQSTPVQSAKAQIKTMKAHMATLAQLKLQQIPSIQLLNTLQHLMPEGVYLNLLSLHENQITLSGRAVTQDQIETLMKNLKKYPVIADPKLNPSEPDNTQPPYHFNFTVHARLGSEGP